MKEIVLNQPFSVVATIQEDKLPHLIVVSDKWIIDDEILVFGRWQMKETEKNLDKNSMVIVLGIDPEKRRSVKFFGKGYFEKRKKLPLDKKADRFDEFLVVNIKRIQYGQWGQDTNTDFAFDHTWEELTSK